MQIHWIVTKMSSYDGKIELYRFRGSSVEMKEKLLHMAQSIETEVRSKITIKVDPFDNNRKTYCVYANIQGNIAAETIYYTAKALADIQELQ